MVRFIAFLAAGLVATSAAAQMGNPGFWSAQTRMEKPGQPAPHQTNNTDQLFAQLAAAGGIAEVDFARLAGDKAGAKSVKDFAELMLHDHDAANAKLKQLASDAKIPLPDKISQDDVDIRKRLDGLKGRDFDIAYIKGQIVDHQKTVQLLEWEIDQGEDAALQRYAAETLPKILHHLELAHRTHATLTGAAMQ